MPSTSNARRRHDWLLPVRATPVPLAAAILWLAAAAAQAQEAEPVRPDQPLVEELIVEAPSRLHGAAARADGLTVQVVEREELEAAGARTVQEALQGIPGVHLTDEQGNSHQQDLTMRGFIATSVTGLPQGVSVFLDGVRLNEPGVEEVNFNLIPLTEVERIEIIRGPSSAFGRNTLGGAINIITRRGGDRLESEVEVEGGSWRHREAHARVAGPLGPLESYLAVGAFDEEGLRVEGGAKGAQAFGKLGFRREGTDLTLSYQAQIDRIQQAGSMPLSMLQQDRRGNFTAGDFFRPKLHLLTFNGTRPLGAGLSLMVNTFFRALDAEQYNSSFLSEDTRMFNRTRSIGGAAQLEHQATFGSLRNRLTLGAEATSNAVRFRVHEEPNAQFPTAEDGSPLPRLLAELADAQVALGAFVQDGVRVAEGPLAGLGATASLRYDRVDHDVDDTSPVNTGGATGTASYDALTPALGLAWNFAPKWLATASYTGGFRAPAFLEITCANPDAPCIGLQAGVAPDATLTQLRAVRSRALEAGLQTSPLRGLTTSLSAFRVDLRNDIYSVTPQGTTFVYFQNIGDTRRQGVEATLRLRRRQFDVDASYTYTRATFESDVDLATSRTPTGTQAVRRGDDLPLTPRHRLDLVGRVRPWPWLTLEAGALYVGAQVYRGDEANDEPHLPAYVVARSGVEVRWGEWSAFLRVQNLLDRRYENFGTFAPDGKAPGQPVVPFLNPGAPLNATAGLRWELG
jgi:outer membrane receptor protein involved in Fe transport